MHYVDHVVFMSDAWAGQVWGAVCIKTLKKKVIYALLVYILNTVVHIINTALDIINTALDI